MLSELPCRLPLLLFSPDTAPYPNNDLLAIISLQL